MTLPAWLETAERDEAAELEAMIGAQLGQPMDDVACDVVASDLLRILGAVERDVQRITETRDRELAMIRDRYQRQLDPLNRQLASLLNALAELAKRAGFDAPDAKQRSRKVGFGTYGCRTKPATVEITDPALALAEVKQFAPTLVKVKESVGVTEVKAYQEQTGALPAGCGEVPASITYYAKSEGGVE